MERWAGTQNSTVTVSCNEPFLGHPPPQLKFQWFQFRSWCSLGECPASSDSLLSCHSSPSCLVGPWSETQTQSWHLPSLACRAESEQWIRIQKHIRLDILRFYHPPTPYWIEFQINPVWWETSAHVRKPRQLHLLSWWCMVYGINFYYEDP